MNKRPWIAAGATLATAAALAAAIWAWSGTHPAPLRPDPAKLAAQQAQANARRELHRLTTTPWKVLEAPAAHITAAAFSPDGQRLACGCDDGIVRLWNPASGWEPKNLEGMNRPVVDLAWSDDGTRLAAGSFNGDIRVWDPATADLIDVRTQPCAVACIRFLPGNQNRRLLTVCGQEARVWTVGKTTDDGAIPATGQDLATMDVTTSKDGAPWILLGDTQGVVQVWSDTGDLLRSISRPRWREDLAPDLNKNWPWDIAGLPAGRALVADRSGVWLWDITGSGAPELVRYGRRSRSVAATRDGRWLVTGGYRSFAIYDLPERREIGGLDEQLPAEVRKVVVSPAGNLAGLVMGGSWTQQGFSPGTESVGPEIELFDLAAISKTVSSVPWGATPIVPGEQRPPGMIDAPGWK